KLSPGEVVAPIPDSALVRLYPPLSGPLATEWLQRSVAVNPQRQVRHVGRVSQLGKAVRQGGVRSLAAPRLPVPRLARRPRDHFGSCPEASAVPGSRSQRPDFETWPCWQFDRKCLTGRCKVTLVGSWAARGDD